MDNLELYSRFAPVPDKAKKKITGGKLNGKTDINPMWRLKTLTETFGPCGFGFYTEIKEHWTETADGESAAWVRINLFVRNPETGEWSKPIEGIGGSKQNGKGQGDGINEEVFKMAETDAISVACKKLGMGADVYWDADRTKYTGGTTPRQSDQAPVQEAPAPAAKKAPTKPVIEEGNPLWEKAIAYCVIHSTPAADLAGSYTISEDTIKKLQKAIDERTNF